MEDEAENLLVGQLFARPGQTAIYRFLQQLFPIQPLAVVLQFDDYVTPLVVCFQLYHSIFRLPCRLPFGGRFDAVVHGVAHHVRQRIYQFLHDILVQLGVLAHHLHLHLFVALASQVAHGARHALKGRADGHHAQRHGNLLDVVGNLAQLGDILAQLLVVGVEHQGILGDLGLGDYQLAHHIHQLVQLFGAHPHIALVPLFVDSVAAGLLCLLDHRLGLLFRFRLFPRGNRRSCVDWNGRLFAAAHCRNFGQESPGVRELNLFSFQLRVEFFEQFLEEVGRFQHDVQDRRRYRQLFLARRVEHILNGVGNSGNAVQIEETSGPLDGVERAEHGVEKLIVRGIRFQRQQGGLRRLQVLFGFGVEVGEDLGVHRRQIDRRALPIGSLLRDGRRRWQGCEKIGFCSRLFHTLRILAFCR